MTERSTQRLAGITGGLVSIVLLFGAGCSSKEITCTAPTKLNADGTACIYEATNDGGGLRCGPNTRQDSVTKECKVIDTVCGVNQVFENNRCVVSNSVCQAQGTVFDEATKSCKVPSEGELVGSSPFTPQYTHVFVRETATSTTLKPLGNLNQETAGPNNGPVTDRNTPIYNRSGKPMGAFISTAIPQFGPAVPVDTPMAVQIPARRPDGTFEDPDLVFSVEDWAQCAGSSSFYKLPEPINGKKYYKMVVDMTNCLPLTLYSVWLNWSPDGTRQNNTLSAFAGGIPATVNTDENGNAHFERLLDPEIWFKSGATMPWGAQFRANDAMVIPDITQNPNAGVLVVIIYHSNGETNGNPGQCVTDMNGMCLTPQPPIVFSLHFPIDAHTHLYTSDPIPLANLQPF